MNTFPQPPDLRVFVTLLDVQRAASVLLALQKIRKRTPNATSVTLDFRTADDLQAFVNAIDMFTPTEPRVLPEPKNQTTN